MTVQKKKKKYTLHTMIEFVVRGYNYATPQKK